MSSKNFKFDKPPLTPLHRLARFNEIRDRNLAREKILKKNISAKRHSLASSHIMEAVHNGVSRSEAKLVKMKNVEKMSNGSDTPSHTNGEHATNGNGLDANPVNQVGVEVDEVVQIKKSPQMNGNSEPTIDAVDPDATLEVVQESTEFATEERRIEEEAENESGSEAGQESEGSSLDVVGESSSEPLVLQLSPHDSEETSGNDAGPSHIPEISPVPVPEESPVTPDIVRKIRAGGRIAARRNLRGEVCTPAPKRKLDDEDEAPSGKKPRDDGTIKSPGWQFFSPSKSFSKFWTPHQSTPNPGSVADVEQINEEIELVEESRAPGARRWCAIM